MKLEEIDEIWNVDALLLSKEEEIKTNSLRISTFHSKYDNILSREEYLLIKLKKDYDHIRMQKYDVISDGASRKQILEEDLDLPRNKMVKSKSEADIYLDGNGQLADFRVKIELCQVRINKLQRIITRINNIHWDYKNYISMRQFENGN
jgi:superfamily I DNA/RNA helicase